MKVFTEIAEVRGFSRECRRQGKRIGFVPTMGFLHEGHLSLVKIAREHSDVVIASNYVNPTQFAAHEDFGVYPIERIEDRAKLESAGCDAVYEPASLYSEEKNGWDTAFIVGQTEQHCPYQTFVNVERLEMPLCGITRPHFFRGVATVVAKLFNIVEPDVAVFGLKDYQQFQVVKTMTRELNFDIDIIGGPTQREADGLAMSSRNALLREDVRPKCSVLYQSLKWAEAKLLSGDQTSPDVIIDEIERRISEKGGKVDYVKVVDEKSLQDLRHPAGNCSVVIAVAAFFVNKDGLPLVRLIDNIKVSIQ